MTTETEEKRKILEMFGDPQVMLVEMQAFARTSEFLDSKLQELIKSHPGQHVAAYDRRICAFGSTIEEVRDQLDAQGVPRGRAAWAYLDPNPIALHV